MDGDAPVTVSVCYSKRKAGRGVHEVLAAGICRQTLSHSDGSWKKQSTHSLFVFMPKQCLWLIDRLRLTEKKVLHSGEILKELHHCAAGSEQKTKIWRQSGVALLFQCYFYDRKHNGNLPKALLINQGYLQLMKSNNPLYYSLWEGKCIVIYNTLPFHSLHKYIWFTS